MGFERTMETQIEALKDTCISHRYLEKHFNARQSLGSVEYFLESSFMSFYVSATNILESVYNGENNRKNNITY